MEHVDDSEYRAIMRFHRELLSGRYPLTPNQLKVLRMSADKLIEIGEQIKRDLDGKNK